MSNKMLTITGIQPKPYKHNGKLHSPVTNDIYNAEIVPNKSIRIYGAFFDCNRYDTANLTWVKEHKTFDRTFVIGAEVEYDSYNLAYTGKIVAIGPKTVTVDDRGEIHRLDLYTFCWRNWDFDAVRTAQRNAETMQHI